MLESSLHPATYCRLVIFLLSYKVYVQSVCAANHAHYIVIVPRRPLGEGSVRLSDANILT